MSDKTIAQILLIRDSIAAYVRSIGLVAVAIFSVDTDWSALRVRF